MRTVTTSAHVLRLADSLLLDRGLPRLTEQQAEVLAEAIDRWYGLPLDLPNADEVAALAAQRRPR